VPVEYAQTPVCSRPLAGGPPLPPAGKELVDRILGEICQPIAQTIADHADVLTYQNLAREARSHAPFDLAQYEQAKARFNRLDFQARDRIMVPANDLADARARLDELSGPYAKYLEQNRALDVFRRLVGATERKAQRELLNRLQGEYSALAAAAGPSPTSDELQRMAAVHALHKIVQMPDAISGKLEELLTAAIEEPAASAP
jgi:hypothetical protein